MISLENISVSLGGQDILKKLSLQFKSGEKIGLTGVNGSGKSTLLKLIAGQIEYFNGKINKPKGFNTGYLPQEIHTTGNGTVIEETRKAFGELLRMEKEIRQLEIKLEKAKNTSETAEQLQKLLDLYQITGGYEYKGKTETILKGLGFRAEDFSKPVTTLSGGWRMRIELAKILLRKSDLLLLDEPTNHLDMISIIWLEKFLRDYKGIVLVVSHDQSFLDHVTTRTIKLRKNGSYWDFPYPYSKFLQHKKEIIEKINRTAENQEKEIKAKEKLIEKFRYKATKAKFAQSLIKKLEKTERIEKIEEHDHSLKINFQVSDKPGKIIFEAKNLSKSYGEKLVLKDLNFIIARGEKIAFVGQNGMGKTTLAGILAGQKDFDGQLNTGHNIKTGYFAQDQSNRLQPELTVLETLEQAATTETFSKIRDIAGAFLFSGDDVYKKVKVLSGGEKNRLAMAALLLRPFNVLILDEPTNHLDIPSKNILKEALKKFDGTLIVVSHDRHFLSGLTQKVWEFKLHKISEYPGDITEFLEIKKQKDLSAWDFTDKSAKNKQDNNQPKEHYIQRKNQRKELKRIKNKIQNLEREIEILEKNILEMEQTLSENPQQSHDFFTDYDNQKLKLNNKMEEWEKLHEQIEKMEN